jgi:hypothetical protein
VQWAGAADVPASLRNADPNEDAWPALSDRRGAQLNHSGIRGWIAAVFVLVAVTSSLSPPLAGQVVEGDVATGCSDTLRVATVDLATLERDIGRTLQLAGAAPAAPALLRRGSTERTRAVCPGAAAEMAWALEPAPTRSGVPTVRLLPFAAELDGNSQYRRARNNGAFRGGVGPSTSLSGGVEVSWRGFTAAVAPRIIRDANDDFETVPAPWSGRSIHSNPYHIGIDLPQRFGTGTEVRFDPGQSYIRYGTRHFELGVSTENVWLGAAQVYPIMLSATAPGFPHVFAGTVQPIDIRIGDLGVHAIWARVSESGYFDSEPENDRRLFAAGLVEFSPRVIPGLHLGLARVYHETIPPGGLPLDHWLGSVVERSFTFAGGGNREGNAIGALLARWVLPAAGFEAYAEWTREDTPHDMRDLIEEPDWTQAYTIGFHQLVTLRHVRLRWYGELIHLGEAAPVRAGKSFSYYTHSTVIQGHTHDGQLLGASPGPGSDAQIVGVDGFHRWGMSGLWVERTRTDDDTYYRRYARMYGESRHDVELGIGARHVMPVGPVRIAGEVLYNKRANRSFLHMEDRTAGRLVERNVGVRLRASWRP